MSLTYPGVGLKSSWRSLPVTAVHHIGHTNLVLAAQGGLVQLLDGVETLSREVSCIDLLGGRTVHGFADLEQWDEQDVIAVWGANLVQLLAVRYETRDQPPQLRLLSLPCDVGDWIMGLCAVPRKTHPRDSEGIIAFLDAHNEVRWLLYDLSAQMLPLQPILEGHLQRRIVMLYSGHICYIDGRLVVASGTMFGQVLFEAYDLCLTKPITDSTIQLITRDIFHDHEGSVFGVRIFDQQINLGPRALYRLASCSDDRTLRICEIPAGTMSDETLIDGDGRTGFIDFLDLSTATPRANIGSIMGHESRIWRVLWLDSMETHSRLMTFGEDTTAQVWEVTHSIPGADAIATSAGMAIRQLKTTTFHSGKNVWAAAVQTGACHSICTGGADGRIASYTFAPLESGTTEGASLHQNSISPEQIAFLAKHASRDWYEGDEETEKLFLALEGRWILTRTIVSKRPEFPSGDFVGEAVLTRRPPTEEGYDSELLYEEQGQFTMSSGMSFTARRNYVYRHQKSTDTITAWFVQPDHQTEVDYLFHQVEFKDSTHRRRAQASGADFAEGYHLCVADHYNASYEFSFGREVPDHWSLVYDVKGPQKDYKARSSFKLIERPNTVSAQQTPDTKALASKVARPDSFRSYAWLTKRLCLIVTDHGRVLTVASEQSDTHDRRRPLSEFLNYHGQMQALNSYSIACTLDTNSALIAAGNGDLFRFWTEDGEIELVASFDSKVVALVPAKRSSRPTHIGSVVLKCLREDSLRLLSFACGKTRSQSNLEQYPSVQLAISKSFLPVSASFMEDDRLLAVGSRMDGISLWHAHDPTAYDFRPLSESQNVKLHGTNAITSIVNLSLRSPSSDSEGGQLLLTTGRDGMVKIHTFGHGSLSTVHALKWPFGPNLEGAFLGSSLLLWGFDGIDFVALDYAQGQEMMRTTCGNAHRNWVCEISEEGRNGFRGSLAWTQANSCHLNFQEDPSHNLFATGTHGREIKALSHFDDGFGEVVATGAEDTDIKLFTFVGDGSQKDNSAALSPHLQCRATLARHQTGVTKLELHESLLFSAGGKEELFMWRLQRLPSPLHLGVKFEAICPKVEDGLLRITDFCVMTAKQSTKSPPDQAVHLAIVYSDSSLRTWRCTYEPAAFALLETGRYTEHSLTCVGVLGTLKDGACEIPVLITASTDGHIILWCGGGILGMHGDGGNESNSCESPEGSLQVKKKFRVHDSAIKTMLVADLATDHHVVVTGGDDGAVVVSLLSASRTGKSERYVANHIRIPQAHAAAVNALAKVDFEFDSGSSRARLVIASTGSDQMVFVWEVDVSARWGVTEDAQMHVRRRGTRTAVADASGVIKLSSGLLIVGVGMEIIKMGQEANISR